MSTMVSEGTNVDINPAFLCSDEKFSVVVSNPPYQEAVSSITGKSMPIWTEFVFISQQVSNSASFINPARWLTAKPSPLSDVRRMAVDEKRLKHLAILDSSLFESVGIVGNLTISLFDFLNDFDYYVYADYSVGSSQHAKTPIRRGFMDSSQGILSLQDENIISKVLSWQNFRTVKKELFIAGQDNRTKREATFPVGDPRADHCLMSQRLHRDVGYFVNEDEKLSDVEYTKIYYIDSGEVCFKFLEASELGGSKNAVKRVDKWQLLFLRSSPEKLYHYNVVVAEPGSLGTNSWMARNFESCQEAENFQTYLATHFYRYLLGLKAIGVSVVAEAHSFVPELSDTLNPRTKLIGYESDWTDEDLQEVFINILTVDDWNYIHSKAQHQR